jgi:Patatin-like phospholipase
MKEFLKNFYYSFPIQLLLLHFRKSQVLLIFWFILFLAITGNFLKLFGANALFLAPEYLGNVNAGGAAITGVATGVYIMSWNITTFILHSQRFRFLATNSKPFLKYCVNNSIIPACFLVLYFFEAISFDRNMELIPLAEFIAIAGGFIGGLFLVILLSFAYFFTADRRIVRTFKPGFIDFDENKKFEKHEDAFTENNFGLPVGYYLTNRFRLRKARKVGHYSQEFLDTIFKRHHFSAIITIMLAFIFMVFIGFFLDHRIFQVPAAASILILFALLIAVIGALSYFMRSWSILFVALLFIVLNILYNYNIIDPRNKAFGLDYTHTVRPDYSLKGLEALNTLEKIEADKSNMIGILNRWKAKQDKKKPLLIVFNFSGGGVRSATFAMNILQELDSISKGTIMKKTVLISGASGGMLAAAYFRELTRLKASGEAINVENKKYVNNISKDLLNPIFSSMIARDLLSPAQKFSVGPYRYVKDRGYAFEQKLNENTRGVLDKNIGFYKEDEENARIPLMILNSVITRDLKKMMVSTQPISFMMQPTFVDSTTAMSGPDAVDFAAMFKNENPMNLRLLTALRMNASYPYILPSVWLPSHPVIDVMDAGLRDNYGQETSLRFLNVFRSWIKENTSGVLIIQVRAMQKGSWATPYENGGILNILTKPFSMLQVNWFRLQDYFQDDEITYIQNLDSNFHRVNFMYIPEKEEKSATLNFHLTAREKKEVIASAGRKNNMEAFEEVKKYLQEH